MRGPSRDFQLNIQPSIQVAPGASLVVLPPVLDRCYYIPGITYSGNFQDPDLPTGEIRSGGFTLLRFRGIPLAMHLTEGWITRGNGANSNIELVNMSASEAFSIAFNWYTRRLDDFG